MKQAWTPFYYLITEVTLLIHPHHGLLRIRNRSTIGVVSLFVVRTWRHNLWWHSSMPPMEVLYKIRQQRPDIFDKVEGARLFIRNPSRPLTPGDQFTLTVYPPLLRTQFPTDILTKQAESLEGPVYFHCSLSPPCCSQLFNRRDQSFMPWRKGCRPRTPLPLCPKRQSPSTTIILPRAEIHPARHTVLKAWKRSSPF